MSALSTIARSTITTMIMLLSGSVTSGDEKVALFIDGKVRTHGVSLDGARVVIDRDGVQLNVLTGDVGRINMRLELGHVYLLSFERKGCMTKELLFDTNVPKEAVDFAPFTFPFKVTLEKRDLEAAFRYSQPVGYIRYYPSKKDFDYDTDYALHRERPDKSDGMRASSIRSLGPGAGSLSENGTNGTLNEPSFSGPTGPSAPPTSARSEYVDRTNSPLGTHDPGSALRGRFQGSTAPQRSAGAVAIPIPDGRTDELIVQPTFVARVVRITELGRTREYRRVEHRYGDTHYFLDGSSCGEATFMAGVHED
jgi:hypothetical protein